MNESTSNRYLYIAVFTSGLTTLAVEMTASRLLGSFFGTSNLVWANVIGLMLLYLTVGYFIGGRIADRHPRKSLFYQILLWGAFLSALVPMVARPVLATAASALSGIEAGLTLGAFVSVLALFAVPITLLGTISPFAIRLAVSSIDAAGKTSGRIYAISTLGSLIGTFLPVLFIIPELGTFATFLLFAGILYIVGLIGLATQNPARARIYLAMPVVVAILSAIALNTTLRSPIAGATIVYQDESAYNFIEVQEDASGNRYLYLNERQGIHSQWHPTQIGFGRTWDFFLSAPYFNPSPYTPDRVENMLLVGLAAGTIARQYIHVYGDIPIDGIEIDGGIVEAGARFFEMNADAMPSLTVYVEDGRYILNQLDQRYSVVAIDAYRPPYIPWHLTTVEFFQEVREHLTDDGVVAINVGRTRTDRRLIGALTNTMRYVFPSTHIHTMDVPNSFNTIVVATVQPSTWDHLLANSENLPSDASPYLRETLQLSFESLVPTSLNQIVFTDDRAPVETLVDSLVLNFLFSDDLNSLRN